MSQLDLFAPVTSQTIECGDLYSSKEDGRKPYVPEGDEPGCCECAFFKAKVIPIGTTGGWIGHAGDCSKHGQEVATEAFCSEFSWASDGRRERHEAYLKRVGRPLPSEAE